ncbi:alpha/beta hydrolase [Parvibaculum sp.]|uniref:alpha/beta hydrolase n=1 Tax=Parvibaculum sp. TaxID=2024848 RepID=UPI0027315E61|nr:alpha/beta hydrolase [Parvibaculum sp.]MDP1626477.1 alpha/beta hydrolase [Parvibaculum sp.]MDP2150399.1 alpha/beta hydrolase [Parvibaculum sp.]MDP3326851.1 alpha/beta hydrolase [Parvibaculum sp.]
MNIQKAIIRLLMKLPDGALVRLSGGKPLAIDGRIMDARMQFLAAQGARGPSIVTLDPVAARAATSQGLALLDGEPRANVEIADLKIPGPAGPLDARLCRPHGVSGPLPGLVFFHFGGCVIGDLDTCHTFCTMIADIAGVAVLNVAYRLAPEHKFPAAGEDAVAAYKWAEANAASLGMVPGRIGVGGDSAGGYLSAHVAQETKREGFAAPAVQLLIYPVTDWAWKGGSMESCANVYPLPRDVMDWFGALYMNSPADANDPRLSPMKSPDLSGLAPAIIVTAGFDVLRDQGAAYAEKLKAAGVPVTYRCEDNLAHAFTAMTGILPAANAACERIARDVGATLRKTG